MATPTNTYDKAESGLKSYAKKAPLTITSALTGDSISFAAFLNSFSQNFTSNWSSEEVYGRNDPISTFQGTKRSISISFEIPSNSLESAKSALSGCNKLAKFLYPGYLDSSQASGKIISRPPLVKIKFANLISNGADGPLLGFLDGLEWNPLLEMGMFHEGASSFKLYPKVISLAFTFNVLHQKDIGWGENNKWDGKLIG